MPYLTTEMSPPPPPLAHELLIAQLAVQRAALVTKRVLATLNLRPPGLLQRASTEPISRFLHPDECSSPTSPTITTATTPPNGPLGHPHPGLERRLSLAKPDTSPVTVADFAAQALLVAAVHHAFPADRIVGEEDADALRSDPDLVAQVWELVSTTRLDDAESEARLGRPGSPEEMMELIALGGASRCGRRRRFWCMDPIDGTSAFLKGGQYAISLALLEDGRELLGVLGCPNLAPAMRGKVAERVVDRHGMGLMLAAVKGQGATWRPMGHGALREATRVDRGMGKPFDLREIHLVDSSRSPATLTEKVRDLAAITGAVYPAQTELYSSHMRYAAMALGGREFVQLRWPKPGKGPWSIWDHAGSQLIYTESGAGRVTDLAGNPIDFTTGKKLSKSWGLITADESIHGKILALVDSMLAADANVNP
ncbi:uncharacterized protein B0T15DRAFT_435311 [Chaetomium strumarium]|uniref:3'(2'),5'-bisphosphate nucleotidase n=1 Tax=Chaetomium strumarium TaxID=1170767 RepID=A0AAJ0M201_9PEZI|nr:hypothetical protein B0T15DRAFT_435311 [Chaetomium strumarium]